jgi:nitroimidazol reductase NimA-like FMN-containing flavoprotein (pyridoxamine 5'-phosphate oxidase superfamily)
MKATRGHIPWSNVDRRLHSMREIWVATTSPKGRPDATPVWFWWDGEAVYFTCAAVARKARNIANEPEVVMINGDGADPIIIKGRAERVTLREARTS